MRGVVIATPGAVPWVTVTCAEAVFPAASVAAAVIVFVPSVRETWVVNAPLVSATACPFTVKLEIATASETVPVTVTWLWVVAKPFAGALMATTGGVVSSVALTDVLVLARLFVAVAVSVSTPWASGTLAVYEPPDKVAWTPFTETVTGAVPVTLPVTAIGV
jgi:hypothetical protein